MSLGSLVGNGLIGLGTALLAVTLIVGHEGCTTGQAVQGAADVAGILSCVAKHEADHEGAGQIAIACGLANAQAVVDLIGTMDRRAAAKFARDGGS